jgi:ParB family chromosome partitioning protein
LQGGILIAINKELDRLEYLPINDIKVGPDHLRKNPGNINNLKSTISDVGLLQPIIVCRSGGSYTVIDGERRLRAMKELGISELIVGREVIVDLEETHADAIFKQIIANIQREDINPFDLGHAFVMLKQAHGYKYKEIAEIIGKTPDYITSKVGLVKRLDPDLQEIIATDWYLAKSILDRFSDDSGQKPIHGINVKVIEDIARLPLEQQKIAYISIKSKEMRDDDALKYLRAIKKMSMDTIRQAGAVSGNSINQATPDDELIKYVEKLTRDIENLVTRFHTSDQLKRQDMISKIEVALEKLSSLYTMLKSDAAFGGEKSQNKAIV